MFPIATLTPNGVSSAAFTNIPQTFTHLVIHATAFSAAASGALANFNSDSIATNYARSGLSSTGAAVQNSSAAASGTTYIWSYAGYQDATTPYGAVMTILDYSNTTKNKVMRVYAAGDRNGAGGMEMNYLLWENTAAITRIDILNDIGSNWVTPTRFSLYGVSVSSATGA